MFVTTVSQDAKVALGVRGEDCLIDPGADQNTILLSNATGFTRHLEIGEVIGEAFPVIVVDLPCTGGANTFKISTATSKEADDEERSRRRKLME